MLTGAVRYQHLTLILMELQWLLGAFWAQFKLLLPITDKAPYRLDPGYLKDHLILPVSARPLWSPGEGLLRVPTPSEVWLIETMERAFCYGCLALELPSTGSPLGAVTSHLVKRPEEVRIWGVIFDVQPVVWGWVWPRGGAPMCARRSARMQS